MDIEFHTLWNFILLTRDIWVTKSMITWDHCRKFRYNKSTREKQRIILLHRQAANCVFHELQSWTHVLDFSDKNPQYDIQILMDPKLYTFHHRMPRDLNHTWVVEILSLFRWLWSARSIPFENLERSVKCSIRGLIANKTMFVPWMMLQIRIHLDIYSLNYYIDCSKT